MKFACLSNIGLRSENEDSFCSLSRADGTILLAVADGMGGHEKGEVASAMAVQAVRECLNDAQPCDAAALQQAVAFANRRICDAANGSDMGTTLVLALAGEDTFTVANVGDSRLYHFNGRSIRQVTRDHSLVEELIASGEITAHQARSYPYRNVITRALGTETTVEADIFCESWQAEDVLLLCSDGLTGSVGEETLEEILSLSLSCEETCRRLVELALKNGATDNITVIIARNEGSGCV